MPFAVHAVPGHSHTPVRFVVTPEVAQAALRIAKAKVSDHLTKDGEVTGLVKGSKLAIDATNDLGVVRVHGRVNVNAQWGDVGERSFSALIDTNKHTMHEFRTW